MVQNKPNFEGSTKLAITNYAIHIGTQLNTIIGNFIYIMPIN